MGRNAVDKARIKDPKKRSAWIDQLMPVFFNHGIKAIGSDRVAQELNKSKATVYKHFESHREIVLQVLQAKLIVLQQFGPILEDESKSYPERYQQAVEFVSVELQEVSTLFLSDLKAIYPELWELVNAFKSFAIGQLRAFYMKGVEADVFADFNPDLMVLSDELFFDVLTDAEYLSTKGLTLKTAFDEYFRMRFNGILNRESLPV